MDRYRVVRVGRISRRKAILRRGLTEREAQTIVRSYPNSNRSMVYYSKQ